MDLQSTTKINKVIRLSLGKSILLLTLIVLVFITPVTTHAGILSSIASFFSGNDVSAQAESVIESSSQTIDLQEPATNIDPLAKIDTPMVIDGGEALLSEVGPSNLAPDALNTSSDQISIYTVRTGDTFAGIAKMFDVSVNTILWANDMTKSSPLKVGGTLVILPMSGVMHTVVKGDTLSSIAKKYSGDLNEIAAFNDLAVTDALVIGDDIMIPDGEVSSSIRPSAKTTSKIISSDSGPSYAGYYTKPFAAGHKTQGIHGHNGVDYGMPIGTTLYAAAAGKVIIAKNSGYNGGYGDYVVIQHANNTQTVYGHMSSVSVSVGQTVTQGQTIGLSGNTGKSTGPHLHFEVRGAKNPF